MQATVLRVLRSGGLALDFSGRSVSTTAMGFPSLRFLLLKARDIPGLVASGRLLCGVAGLDYVLDQGFLDRRDLREAADLCSAKSVGEAATWKCAVAVSRSETSLVELCSAMKAEGNTCRVATEIPNVVSTWLNKNGAAADILPTTGSTEAYIPGLVDCIVDVVHSGDTLRENGLRELDVVLTSTARLWVSEQATVETLAARVAEIIQSGVRTLGIERAY